MAELFQKEEGQARGLLNLSIPTRRVFAGRDVKQEQEFILGQKRTAKQVLKDISKARQQQAQFEQEQAEQKELQKQYNRATQKINNQIRRLDPYENVSYDSKFAKTLPAEVRKYYKQTIEEIKKKGDSRNAGVTDRLNKNTREFLEMGYNEEQARALAQESLKSSNVKQKALEKKGFLGKTTKEGVVFEKIPQRIDTRQTLIPTEKKQIIVNDVRPTEKPKGKLERVYYDLQQQFNLVETRDLRKQSKLTDNIRAVGLGVTTNLIGTALAIKTAFTQSPIKTAKDLGGGIINAPKTISRGFDVLETSPSFAVGYLGGEAISLKGSKVAFKVAGKTFETVKTIKSPIYRPIIKEGNKALLKLPSESGGTFKVEVFQGGVKELAEPLTSQVKLAGKEVTAVSGARNLFGKITKRKVKIDKPLINPQDSPLEKSFFADPRGKLRVKRIIVEQPEANLLDVLSGDVTFKKELPQAIIEEKAKIQAFPKSLKGVEKKLLSGKKLTKGEEARLLKFQLTPSGQFKPVGYLSVEPETTLAPKEIIKKQKVLGVTLIDGRRVELIKPKISLTTPEEKALLSKEALTTKDLKALKKSTGISYKPISTPRISLSRFSYGISKIRTSSPISPSSKLSLSSPISPSSLPSPISRIKGSSSISPTSRIRGGSPVSYSKYSGYSSPIISSPPVSPPFKTPPTKTTPFKLPSTKYGKPIKKKKERQFTNVLTYTPDLTSQAFKITRTVSKKDLPKLLRTSKPIGIRSLVKVK